MSSDKRMKDLIQKGHEQLCLYDPRYVNILEWRNKFEYLIETLLVLNDQMTEFLLSMIEPWIVSKIYLKVAPSDPMNISYVDLLSTLEDMYANVHGINAIRYRFNHRSQYFSESIAHYANVLKILVEQCDLGENKHFLLTAQFVNGLFDVKIRYALMTTVQIFNFDEAVKIAEKCEIKVNKNIKND